MAKDSTKKNEELDDDQLGSIEEARSEFDAMKEAGADYKVKVYYKGRGKLKAWKADFDHLPEESEILQLHNENPAYWELGTYKAVLIAYDSKGKVTKDREVTMNIGTFNTGPISIPVGTERPAPSNGHDRQDQIRSFKDRETGQIFYEEPFTGRTYTLDAATGNKIYDRISRLADDDEEEFEIRPDIPIRGKDDLFMLMLKQMQVDANKSSAQQADMFKFMMTMNQQNMQMLVTVLSSMNKGSSGGVDVGGLMTGMSNMLGTFKGLVGGGSEKSEDGLMGMVSAVVPVILELLQAGKSPAQAIQQVQDDLKEGKMPKVSQAEEPKRIEQPAVEAQTTEVQPVKAPVKQRLKTRSERKAEKEKKAKEGRTE